MVFEESSEFSSAVPLLSKFFLLTQSYMRLVVMFNFIRKHADNGNTKRIIQPKAHTTKAKEKKGILESGFQSISSDDWTTTT